MGKLRPQEFHTQDSHGVDSYFPFKNSDTVFIYSPVWSTKRHAATANQNLMISAIDYFARLPSTTLAAIASNTFWSTSASFLM